MASARAPFDAVIEDADGACAWLSGRVALDLARGVPYRKAPARPVRPPTTFAVAGRTVVGPTWRTRPFTKTPIDEIVEARLDPAGTTVLVRARSWDETGLVRLVAHLDSKTGKLVEIERAGADIVEEARRAYEGSALPWNDAALVIARDQILVVRSSGKGLRTQRLATPPLANAPIHVDGGRLLAIVTVDRATELACIPLPGPDDADELGLVLEPRGPAVVVPAGEDAVVSFAGRTAPFVVFVHPLHGRITLPRGPEQAVPTIGDRAILEGITVKPGVVSARRWSVAGSAPRKIRAFRLAPAPERAAPKDWIAALLGPIKVRAKVAEVTLPSEVVAIVRLVESAPVFREALAGAGVDFDDVDDEALEVLATEEPRFVALYGNGHGGNLIGGWLDGKLITLDSSDGDRITSAPDLASAIRKAAKADSQRKATLAYIEGMLASV